MDYEYIIIEKTKTGDQFAWTMLFKQHFKPVYYYCMQLAGGHESQAQDLAQQVFITAAQKIHKYEPQQGSFRMWLFGITKNCFKKSVAKQGRLKQTDNSCLDTMAQPVKHSQNMLVLETLARLPAHYSGIIEAKYIDKKTISQIALAQNTTEKAAESLLTRAKEKFKEIYTRLKKQEQGI